MKKIYRMALVFSMLALGILDILLDFMLSYSKQVGSPYNAIYLVAFVLFVVIFVCFITEENEDEKRG